MGMDGGLWANILLGLGTAGGILWAAWQTWQKNKVSTANGEAQVAVADAQAAVYTMMTSRLESLEVEMRSVRAELATEREHGRKMEIHIFKLESMMRKAGLEPPLFEG